MKWIQLKRCLVLGIGFLLVACQPKAADNGGRLRVVATATMVTDLVRVIGGEQVQLEGLMGPEVDPHAYEPIMSDTRKLQKADVVFYVGLHLEGQMQEMLEGLARKGKTCRAVSDGVDKKDLLAPQEDFPGVYDPHLWGDPRLWAKCAHLVGEVLAEKDAAHASLYRERAAAYVKELEQLHEWGKKRLAELPKERRILVTSHDAFYYFARAYELEVKGLQGLSSDSEIGAGGREALKKFIRERGVKAVFAESTVSDKGIRGVAQELGISLAKEELYSDAMGPNGAWEEKMGEKYDLGTYIGMQKHNVNSIAESLK